MRLKPKVLLLHSTVSPYRLPLFEAVAKKEDLMVYYCEYKPMRRKWHVPLNEYTFQNRILRCIKLGPFMINPTLPFILLFRRYDVYILGEDQRIFFSKIITFLIAKIFKKPVILWVGSADDNYYEKYKKMVDRYFLRPISKFYYRFADAFIAYGEKTRKYLLGVGIPVEKIYMGTQAICEKQLMKNTVDGLDNEPFFDGKKVILCISYFDRRKGIDDLIEAYKRIDRNDTVLIIAGAGGEEERLRLIASNRKDIVFPGYLEHRKQAYYSLADIFVLPTHSDAWGLTVNEAMMFGVPVITTDQAGCSQELIDGNGFVIRSGDMVKLKEVLEKLLNDDDLRHEMGARSKEIIRKYTIENARKTFISAISHALNIKADKRRI